MIRTLNAPKAEEARPSPERWHLRTRPSVPAWAWGLGLFGVLAGSYLWMGWRTTMGPEVVVRKAPIEQMLWAPGWIEPAAGLVEVSTTMRGIITSMPVKVGNAVSAGQVVATLDNAEAAAKVAQATAAVQQAEAGVAALEAVFKEADVASAQAAALAKDAGWPTPTTGAGSAGSSGTGTAAAPESPAAPKEGSTSESTAKSPPALEALELQAKTVLAQLSRSAPPLLLSSPASRKEALAGARSAVNLAKAQLKEAQTHEGQMTLRAPVSGTVVRLMAEMGEEAGGFMPTPLLAIADLTQLQVRLELDEADIHRVKEGQRGHVRAPATGSSQFPGTVTSIGVELGRRKVPLDDPRAPFDTRVLEVVMRLDTPGPFKLSQRVEAALVLETRPEALLLPVTAIFHRNGEPFVREKGLLGATERKVTLGFSDGAQVEVQTGVEEGLIVLQDPAVPRRLAEE